jgi:hypothetical protein
MGLCVVARTGDLVTFARLGRVTLDPTRVLSPCHIRAAISLTPTIGYPLLPACCAIARHQTAGRQRTPGDETKYLNDFSVAPLAIERLLSISQAV